MGTTHNSITFSLISGLNLVTYKWAHVSLNNGQMILKFRDFLVYLLLLFLKLLA